MFQKKTWKDRIVEFAGRRTLTKIAGSVEGDLIVDVARNEGMVLQEGDAFSAANMNDLEQRIEEAFGITRSILSAGATSITIFDSKITKDSVLSFYTGVYGVNPKTVSVSNGSVALTFKVQTVAMEVGVRIDG